MYNWVTNGGLRCTNGVLSVCMIRSPMVFSGAQMECSLFAVLLVRISSANHSFLLLAILQQYIISIDSSMTIKNSVLII